MIWNVQHLWILKVQLDPLKTPSLEETPDKDFRMLKIGVRQLLGFDTLPTFNYLIQPRTGKKGWINPRLTPNLHRTPDSGFLTQSCYNAKKDEGGTASFASLGKEG